MLILLIWLSDFLNHLSNIAEIIFYIATAILVFLFILKGMVTLHERKEEDYPLIGWLNKNVKKYFFGLFLVLLIGAIIPKKETYYAMLGVYAGQEIIANPQAQALIEKSVKAIEIKLDEVIKNEKETDKEETK